MPGSGDDSHRTHDTDPLADTQHSEDSAQASASASASSSMASKKRVVGAGDTLGRYELIEDVGEGGMATVYRARDRELRREVAIKVLFPHLSRRDEVVRRFHREARAAAGLEHPNILRIYDVGGGESDDPPYIVMELIRGRSLLGEIEQRGPMLTEVAACVGALLADALAAAHQAGVIHRDIKPANVLIAGDGRVLLADFGVARLETEDASLVTRTGALLGTPAYMSPEQASGDTATARSDLYSLGATLYQLVTGALPYAGSPAKVLAQIAQGALVSASRRRAAVGPDLSKVIDRLMAVEPEARPARAAEVATELRAIAAAGGLGDPADELASYFTDPEVFLRAKTPSVVTALLGQAEHALSESRLPRAMALADRASALAPDDPKVQALVQTVTEGGRASRRRRVIALGGAGLALAAGAVFGVRALTGGHQAAGAADGGTIAIALDADGAALAPPDAVQVAAVPLDAGARPAAVDAGARPLDAAVAVRVRDAGVRRRVDAAPVHVTVAPPDAAAAAPRPDAAVVAVAPVDAAPADGFVVVKNDVWCDVSIDGVPRGRLGPAPLRVAAGHHVVVCDQMGKKNWKREVDVPAGQTRVVQGHLLGTVAVTFEIDAQLGGVAYRRGDVAHIPGGRLELVAGAARTYITVRDACTVRDRPELDCYR